MKIWIFAIVFTVLSFRAQADILITKPCTPNCISEVAVPAMQKFVIDSNPSSSSADCPAPGSEVLNAVQSTTGKTLSSSKILNDLISRVSPTRVTLQAENNRCGACNQQNLVSAFTTTAPQQIRTDIECPKSFVRNIQSEMQNQDIETFAENTLRGKTPEGLKFQSDCSTGCSYYVSSAQTPLTATTSRLNMTIFCGPARQGSIVFATYQFSVGFVHQWVCVK